MASVKYAALILWAASLFVTGCTPGADTQAVTLDLTGTAPAVGYDELDKVLGQVVGEDGYVYMELMCERPVTPLEMVAKPPGLLVDAKPSAIYTQEACALRSLLNRQLKRLAVAGPTTTPSLFPTRNERLAYWYNARTAWALRLLLEAWDRRVISDLTQQNLIAVTTPFSQRRFPIDGGTMTLDGIDAAIARQGGPLAVMAAPGLDLRRASLPRNAFEAETVFENLPVRFSTFVGDEKRFVVDILNQRVLVPPVIWQYRESLLAKHRRAYNVEQITLTTALLPLVDRESQRRLQNAIGYSCVRDDRDRYAIVAAD